MFDQQLTRLREFAAAAAADIAAATHKEVNASKWLKIIRVWTLATIFIKQCKNTDDYDDDDDWRSKDLQNKQR